MSGERVQLRTSDLKGAPDLKRPLNDALAGLSLRLEALERVAGVLVLPPVDFRTLGSLGPSSNPFPLRIGVPAGFTPAGVIMLRLEPLFGSAPNNVPNGSVSLMWRPTQADSIEVTYIAGLATGQHYRVTLGAIRG
jgi:hypothetical protein